VGENAKISTGSGNIHTTGLRGGFKVDTGSGDIYAEQTGQGDVRASTGSGNIELRNLRGSLYAHTGSGNIKAGGAPTADWKLGRAPATWNSGRVAPRSRWMHPPARAAFTRPGSADARFIGPPHVSGKITAAEPRCASKPALAIFGCIDKELSAISYQLSVAGFRQIADS